MSLACYDNIPPSLGSRSTIVACGAIVPHHIDDGCWPWRSRSWCDRVSRNNGGVVKRFDAEGLVRLDDEQCWRFLERHFLGRVALVHLGSPMLFPVNYVLDGRSVVFRTAPGTKLLMAAVGHPVAFEVDEASELFETGTSVVAHGTLHEVTDRRELEGLRRLPLRAWAPGDRDHFVRVEPHSVSGRRIEVHETGDGVAADGG